MATTLSRVRNITLTLTILAVLAAATIGYFFFYIAQRESYLHERNTRVLRQISDNIEALNDTYLKNAENNSARDLNTLKDQALVLFNQEAAKSKSEFFDVILKKLEAVADTILPYNKLDSIFILPELVQTLVADDIDYLGNDGFAIQNKAFNQKALQLIPRNNSVFQVMRGSNEEFSIQEYRSSIRIYKDKRERFRLLKKKRPSPSLNTLTKDLQEILDNLKTITSDNFFSAYTDRTNLTYSFLPRSDSSSSEEQVYELRQGINDWEIVYKVFVGADGNGQKYPFEWVRPVEGFMQKVLREDVFSEFFVYRETAVKTISQDTSSNAVMLPDSISTYQYSSIFHTLSEDFFPRELADSILSLATLTRDPSQRHKIQGVPYQIYLQPLKLKDERLVLCGLVNQKVFAQEKTAIAPVAILLLGLIVMLVILAFPTLKLRLMSKYEQLGVWDVGMSIGTLILGVSLIVLLIFDRYQSSAQYENTGYAQLKGLHKEISNNFFSEIDSIYDQLVAYDTLKEDTIRTFEDQPAKDIIADTCHTLFPKTYPYFKSVLWATEDKEVGAEITTDKHPNPKVSIAGRKYLVELEENRGWDLPGHEDGPFMLESILTRTTGEQLAVVAKKSVRKNAPIIFLTTYLHSVIQPILPQGTGFCIIDQSGEVQFHSDKSHNLQENFLEECDNQDFRSAIFSRASLSAEGAYLGIDHDFYMAPLRRLPLFLVIFKDKRYYRSTHAQAISLTFMLVMIFLLSGLLFWVFMYVSRPSSHILKQQYFLLDWLRPGKFKAHYYHRLILMNMILVVLMFVFSLGADAYFVIDLIILGNFLAIAIAFLSLNRNAKQEFIWDNNQFLVFSLISVIVLIFIISFFILDLHSYGLTFSFLFLVFCISCFVVGIPIRPSRIFNQKPNPEDKPTSSVSNQKTVSSKKTSPLGGLFMRLRAHFNERRSYRYFLLSWMVIACIFPVVKFYQVSFDHEQRLMIQHAHVQMSKNIQERNDWINQRYLGLNFEKKVLEKLKQESIYYNSYFQTSWEFNPNEFETVSLTQGPEDQRVNESSQFYTFLSKLRPRFNEIVRQTNLLNIEQNSPSQWRWQINDQEVIFKDPLNKLIVNSRSSKFHVPLLLLFLFLFAFLYLVYRLVDFHVTRLFAQDALESIALPQPSNRRILLNTQKHILLIVPPEPISSDYFDLIRQKRADLIKKTELKGKTSKDSKSPLAVIDLREKWIANPHHAGNLSKLNQFTKGPLLVLNHFEHILEDPSRGQISLQFIAFLREQFPAKQIVVISEVDNFSIDEISHHNFDPRDPLSQKALKGFVKIHYPLDYWEFIYNIHDLEEFVGKRTVLLRLATPPEENESVTLQEVVDKIEGELTTEVDTEAETDNTVYLKKGKISIHKQEIDASRYMLIGHADNTLTYRKQLAQLKKAEENKKPVTIFTTENPTSLLQWMESKSFHLDKDAWEKKLSEIPKGLVLFNSNNSKDQNPVRIRILKECAQDTYLQSLEHELMDQFENSGVSEQQIIKEIETRAHLHYQLLWSSCSEEEKYMIFDLARNGFVNSKNERVFHNLMRKGIIINAENSPKLMSRSFQNFILTAIKPEEALRLTQKIKESDWSQAKLPISILIFALGAFLVITQKEFLDDTTAFFAGITAMIPVVRQLLVNVTSLGTGFSGITNLVPRMRGRKG